VKVSDAPDDYIAQQMKAIVGIELTIDRLEGKWKMSQNRADADIDGVIHGLGASDIAQESHGCRKSCARDVQFVPLPLDSLVENDAPSALNLAGAARCSTAFVFTSAQSCVPATLDHEMRAEMQLHLDRRVEQLVASGLTAEEARLAARREFGNVAVHQEDGRDARRTRWIESTFGRRTLRVSIFQTQATVVGDDRARAGVWHRGIRRALRLLQSAIMRPPPGVPAMFRSSSCAGWCGRRISRRGNRWDLVSRAARDERASDGLLRCYRVDGGQRRRRCTRRARPRVGQSALRHRRLLLHRGLRPASGSGLPASVQGGGPNRSSWA
jgi:hypothetical protein